MVFIVRSLETGGAERQLLVLSSGLHAAGHSVAVVALRSGGSLEGAFGSRGVEVLTLSEGGRVGAVLALPRWIHFLRRRRPDVVHGYLDAGNILAMAARAALPRRRPRIVFGIRASEVVLTNYPYRSRFASRLEGLLSRWCDLAIANSEAGRRAAEDRGFPPDRIDVIGNGLEPSSFEADPAAVMGFLSANGLPEGAIVIGRFARADPMKGWGVLLEAFALVQHRHPEAHLVCVGSADPSDRADLVARASSLGVADHVIVLAQVDDPRTAMAACDLTVSSSRYGEGFPNVVAESMALGVPCIATDVGDTRVVVGDAGTVVPPDDASALAEAIDDLLSLPAEERREIGRRARARIEANFTAKALVARTAAALADQ